MNDSWLDKIQLIKSLGPVVKHNFLNFDFLEEKNVDLRYS